MAESKSIIMSLSVTQDVRDLLRISAKNKGCSVSSLVRELVDKYLSLVVPEGDEISVGDLLEAAAKNKGRSVSSLVRELVEKHLSLVAPEGDRIPVVLKIPGELRGKEEELKRWLDIKSNTIVKALSKVKANDPS
jgi:hypothetical protein